MAGAGDTHRASGAISLSQRGTGQGGAIFNYNGTLPVTSCQFSNNVADNADSISIWVTPRRRQLTLTGVTITNLSGTTNLSQTNLNSGTAVLTSDHASFFTQTAPFVQTADGDDHRAERVQLPDWPPGYRGTFPVGDFGQRQRLRCRKANSR